MAAARLLLALAAPLVAALDNGLGRTPPMGYSSWNDCASEITEQRIKNVTLALAETGLAAKGYVHVNVDEGWLLGRDNATGELVEDKAKFPSGMAALGDWIHAQTVPGVDGTPFKYGLYTSRGTCQCSTEQYEAPGSHGHEVADAQWIAGAGADYLKEDSCCGSPDHDEAFGDYATMRDALNATGRPVYFSLCGWYAWYAPAGASLGNSWRIAGDGTNWGALSECANINAQLTQYAAPGAWNDPDLLQGTGKGSNDRSTNPAGCFDPARIPQSADWYQTEAQARAQFSLWCVMSSPLLISADVGQSSAALLETWGNEELIAVNQHFREGGPYQGERLVGGDLTYDKQANAGAGANVWGKLLPGDDFALVFVSNEDEPISVTCDAACFARMRADNATTYTVRDLWAHADVASVAAPFEFTASQLAPHGGVAAYRISPATV